MAKRFSVHVGYDETEEIIIELKQRKLYSSDLLYRVLTIEGDIASRVREILRRGTDRTSDKISGDEDLDLCDEGCDDRLYERGRPLKPSEYIWLAEEKDLQEQIGQESSGRNLFMLVYKGRKMISINASSGYEFKDKKAPQDALVALIQLHYH